MTIKPFRGYRYNPARVGDLSSVVAPPYDQISPETQGRLHGMSPWSIARITLSRETYAAARSTLDKWLALGIFEQEATPALYPYQQRYTVGGRTVTRTGFIALGEVTDYAEKVVLPHERTHAEPKEDRLRLLAATEADIGLLFMLFDDPGGAIRAATAPEGRPLVKARDLKGEIHRLWRIVDPETIERAQALMADRRVIIADGHHRYETAVAYRHRRPDARYKLMAFFALDAPEVTILPNHRLVRQVAAFALDRLLADAGKWFEVRPLPSPITVEPGTIVVVAGRAPQGAVLRLRPEAGADIPWPVGTSAAWRRLAVSVLHEGILTPLLGITAERLDPRTHVGYTAQAEEAVALVREGAYQAAFLIPPVTPEELRAVVAGGELLPPKSTHFYPKLLDGLVFYRLGGE